MNVEQRPLQRGNKKSPSVGHADFCVVNAPPPWPMSNYQVVSLDMASGRGVDGGPSGTGLNLALEPLYMSWELILKTSP